MKKYRVLKRGHIPVIVDQSKADREHWEDKGFEIVAENVDLEEAKKLRNEITGVDLFRDIDYNEPFMLKEDLQEGRDD